RIDPCQPQQSFGGSQRRTSSPLGEPVLLPDPDVVALSESRLVRGVIRRFPLRFQQHERQIMSQLLDRQSKLPDATAVPRRGGESRKARYQNDPHVSALEIMRASHGLPWPCPVVRRASSRRGKSVPPYTASAPETLSARLHRPAARH